MRRTTMSLAVLLLVFSLLQISTPYGLALLMPGNHAPVVAATSTDPMPVDTLTMLILDSTNDSQTYDLIVSEPAQYSFNMSYIVDSAPPGPFTSVYFNVYLRGSYTQYVPHLNQDIDGMDTFYDDNWFWLTTGSSSTSYTEFLVVQPGRLVLEFDFDWEDLTDQISVNFTLSKLYDLSSATAYDWDQPIETTWTSDNSWAASTFNIPEERLYNVSYYSEMTYTTTTSWGGDPFFEPFTGLSLIDGTFGEYFVWEHLNPSFSIPGGAGSGTANWTDNELYSFLPDDYYLIGEVGIFEYLNSSEITFEMNISPIDMPILDANQSTDLSLVGPPTSSIAFVGIRAPQMYTYNLYFDNHVGANWSLECRDVFAGLLPPYYDYYEDASSYTLLDVRLENSFAMALPTLASSPAISILGNQYIEMHQFAGSSVTYLNGSVTLASLPSGVYQSISDVFYIMVIASSVGTPTPEFNVTLNFEAYDIPVFTSGTDTFSVNQTIGPFYKAYALPVTSGFEYDLKALASDYNSSGVASIFVAPVPQFYLDWQWTGYYTLYQTTPPGAIPIQITNINETAGLKFIAVRTTTLYLGIMGISMGGPPPSDTTEVTFNVSITLPAPYALGSVVTESLSGMEWKTYTMNLAAGTSYRFSLSLDATGNYAICSAFDGLGYTPFDATLFTLWVEVASEYLNSSITYQAITSGPITIVLVADGVASFSLVAVGEAPGSFMLGLMIGIIFLIAGVIIVYVVMRRRY